MDRVVIIANRLPVTAHINGDHVAIEPTHGGLASGLRGPHA